MGHDFCVIFLSKKIKKISTFLKIKGIKTSKHKFIQFIKVFLFLLKTNIKDQQVYTFFKYKFYLVKGFWTNIQIENNIFVFKVFILYLKMSYALVKSYKITIFVKVKPKNQFLKKKFLAKIDRIVLFYFNIMILLLLMLFLDNQDIIFYLAPQSKFILFIYIIIDYKTLKILARIFSTNFYIFYISKN